MSFKLQCIDCGEVFSTPEDILAHNVPEECGEWGNHQMLEVTFRIYTDEMEARDLKVFWSRQRFASKDECQVRALAMNAVIDSGHLDMTEPELIDHLINDHKFGEGARHRWNFETQLMMHWHAHMDEIEAAWWANDRAKSD